MSFSKKLISYLSLQFHPPTLAALEFREDPDHQLVQAGIPQFHLKWVFKVRASFPPS